MTFSAVSLNVLPNDDKLFAKGESLWVHFVLCHKPSSSSSSSTSSLFMFYALWLTAYGFPMLRSSSSRHPAKLKVCLQNVEQNQQLAMHLPKCWAGQQCA